MHPWCLFLVLLQQFSSLRVSLSDPKLRALFLCFLHSFSTPHICFLILHKFSYRTDTISLCMFSFDTITIFRGISSTRTTLLILYIFPACTHVFCSSSLTNFPSSPFVFSQIFFLLFILNSPHILLLIPLFMCPMHVITWEGSRYVPLFFSCHKEQVGSRWGWKIGTLLYLWIIVFIVLAMYSMLLFIDGGWLFNYQPSFH